MKVLVSACLLGINCKYNGKNNFKKEISSLIDKGYSLIPICPEQLGGLPTPRETAEIVLGSGLDVLKGNSKILNKKGKDVSSNFLSGAKQSLYIAKLFNIDKAVLKEKSPSCGVNFIYNKGILKKGAGITTSLLKLNNIKVISSHNFKEEDLFD